MSAANSANKKRFDLSRTNSICPSPESLLLDGVKKNDLTAIASVLKSNPNLLVHEYPHPDERPILQIACYEEGIQPETVQLLIDKEAEAGTVTSPWKILHLAAQNPNGEILATVIRNLRPDQIANAVFAGDNALHALIKSDLVTKENEIDFVGHVEALLRAGIDINQGDGKNCSAVLWAAKKGYENIVRALLKWTPDIDLESHKLRGKCARDFIKDNLDLTLLPREWAPPAKKDTKELLFGYVKESKQAEFVNCFNQLENKSDFVNVSDGFSTLLQYSCLKGLVRIAKLLLDNKADVNLGSLNRTPIEIVADLGYHELFQLLLTQPAIKVDASILSTLIKNLSNQKCDGIIDHEMCYDILMNKLKQNPQFVDVNGEDGEKKTPIHYAIRYAGQDRTRELLDLDASLAIRNAYGSMPIEDIEPELLEAHLDDCIKFNVETKNYEKQDFEVVFNYHSLLPPRRRMIQDPESHRDVSNNKPVPEMEVINYMSQTAEFKHLLKHPVIVSFLFMKWQRIRWLFYTNLTFYILFVLSLVVYIFSYYGNGNLNETLAGISWCTLNVTFLILLLREAFQVAVSPGNYFKNFENLIEIILIILTSMILYINSPSIDTRKQLSALAILLAAFELVLMVGQHPKLSTNVVMLKTVSVNFFKLLLWYSLLIVAFALSFYILFTKSIDEVPLNKNSTDDESDQFTGPGKSLFKTIVMLTGEFDAGSINFQTYPVTSKLIFSLFVFMITIILLNLLNGLAVSDTAQIKNDAELVGHVARAQHVWYVESMLVGNILPTSLMSVAENLCCCIDFANFNYSFAGPLARRVCLFPGDQPCVLAVLPNNYGQIYHEFDGRSSKKRQDDNWARCSGPYCSFTYLDKDTVRRTNAIIKRRREEFEAKSVNGVSLKQLYREQIDLRKKLDEVLAILSRRDAVQA